MNIFAFILALVTVLVSPLQITDMTPIESTSLAILQQNITANQSVPISLSTQIYLKTEADLSNCQVIGSITEINTVNDPTLGIQFVYTLNKEERFITVTFTIRSSERVSETFKMVIDLLVAVFPSDYHIFYFNMTEYQEHIMVDTDRQHELVFFLNGFSNISLSGNITHSFIDEMKMYVIHYMSCIGEEGKMGWIKGKDYVLFTAVVVSRYRKEQKFHLYESFSLDYVKDHQYFYGIKGVVAEKFDGAFSGKPNGMTFHVEYNEPMKSFGLSFISIPVNDDYIDERAHKSSFSIIIVASGVGIFLVVGTVLFSKMVKRQNEAFLVEELEKTDTYQKEEAKDDYQMRKQLTRESIEPIEQVHENLQESNPGEKQG